MSIIYRKNKAFLTLALYHYSTIKPDEDYQVNLKRQQIIHWLCSLKYTRKQLRDRMSDASAFARAHLQKPIPKPSFDDILDAVSAVRAMNPPKWTEPANPKFYKYQMNIVRQKKQAIKDMTEFFGDEANYRQIPPFSITIDSDQ